MDNRREFLKKAGALSGAAGVLSVLPDSIRKAFAIDPEPGTNCFDAEHVVILMQENRSFDHCFGSLRGVRGFNDPRAITLPNGNPVWLQSNAAGETFAPFRLDIHETKATWMGSLPHSWTDQTDARNGGKHNRWLDVKHSGSKDFAHLPLTLGYYARQDIPFYYAMADAFTICDQHFCSSLTGTMPNRLYLWSGTARGNQDASAWARVLNQDIEYENSMNWKTFPERLEEHGISWKVYQNEISLDVGFEGEEGPWLANFGDNPLEWFAQYHRKFSPAHRKYLEKTADALRKQINEWTGADTAAKRDKVRADLAAAEKELKQWSAADFEKLPEIEKSIHQNAFCTNSGDPSYHELTNVTYREGPEERTVAVPKGDVLHQFRRDVQSGSLPVVSWLVAPENFSDHPGAAWYGAWYVSEVLDILTQNSDVWKKTILILTYDENDGYFDHVPPFAAPHPHRPESGAVSKGIDRAVEYVTSEEDQRRKDPLSREGPIGLGYRVPMILASPWSRGGYVCSQVFDHTSVLQFLEKFVSRKAGRKIEETNISAWRRAVCGDLTSSFRPYHGEPPLRTEFLERDRFIREIHQAQFKPLPAARPGLTAGEITRANVSAKTCDFMPKQEPGTRPSCSLPYQLCADGWIDRARGAFVVEFAAKNERFASRAAGAAFRVYAPGKFRESEAGWDISRSWDFAVEPGASLEYSWPIDNFESGVVHLRAYGPNGFFREFRGNGNDPALEIHCTDASGEPNKDRMLQIVFAHRGESGVLQIELADNAYRSGPRRKKIRPGEKTVIALETARSAGWYDFTVRITGHPGFERRYAGRIENGQESISDPAMSGTH